MSDLLPLVNHEQMLEQKLTPETIAENAVNYLPELKNPITDQTRQALHSLSDMVDQGLVEPTVALAWGTGLIQARNRLEASTTVGLEYHAAKAGKQFVSHPQAEIMTSIGRSEDAVFFNHMAEISKKYSKTVGALANAGEWTSKGLAIGSQAFGVVALGYWRRLDFFADRS